MSGRMIKINGIYFADFILKIEYIQLLPYFVADDNGSY